MIWLLSTNTSEDHLPAILEGAQSGIASHSPEEARGPNVSHKLIADRTAAKEFFLLCASATRFG